MIVYAPGGLGHSNYCSFVHYMYMSGLKEAEQTSIQCQCTPYTTHQNLHIFIWDFEVEDVTILNDPLFLDRLGDADKSTLKTPTNQ